MPQCVECGRSQPNYNHKYGIFKARCNKCKADLCSKSFGCGGGSHFGGRKCKTRTTCSECGRLLGGAYTATCPACYEVLCNAGFGCEGHAHFNPFTKKCKYYSYSPPPQPNNTPIPPMPYNPNAKARLIYDPAISAYVSYTPYNKNFVEFVSKRLELGKRWYDDQDKRWVYDESVFELVKLTIEQLWRYDCSIKTKSEALEEEAERKRIEDRLKAQQQQTQQRSYAIPQRNMPTEMLCKQFIEYMPQQALKVAMREAAKLLHPDINKDSDAADKLAQLNSLWDRIQKLMFPK